MSSCKLPKFKIVPQEKIGGFDIFMNDQKLNFVKSVKIDMDTFKIPSISLEFYAHGVDVELPFADPEFKLLAAEKKGHWTTRRTHEHDGEWYCDQCGYEPTVYEGTQYCPNCGSRMDQDK